MTQAVRENAANGMISAPVLLPPGLDATTVGSALPAAFVAELRRSVMEDVDAKVADKMKDVWSRGNKMLKQVEQDSLDKNAKILAELAECRDKQDTLQAEHDNLKTVLSGMVQHLNMLGAFFGGPGGLKAAPPMPSAVAAGLAAHGIHGLTPGPSTTASGEANNSSSAASACSLQDSPDDFTMLGLPGSFPPLPAVPDFPFPAAPCASTPLQSAATPLSLAEALSSSAATPSPSVPLSLMGSLPQANNHRIFSFTLRKADGTDLGLNVSHSEEDKALLVEGVRPEGAVEAWNRQCIGSTASDKAVLPGDRIISVNAVINDPVKMLEECRDKQLLKLTVVRGLSAAPPAASTTLRAEASEFVPGGVDAKEEEPAEEATATASTAEKTENKDAESKVDKEC